MISLVIHDIDKVTLHDYYIAVHGDIDYESQADNLISLIVDYLPTKTFSIATKRIAQRIAGKCGDVDEIYNELVDAILAEGGVK